MRLLQLTGLSGMVICWSLYLLSLTGALPYDSYHQQQSKDALEEPCEDEQPGTTTLVRNLTLISTRTLTVSTNGDRSTETSTSTFPVVGSWFNGNFTSTTTSSKSTNIVVVLTGFWAGHAIWFSTELQQAQAASVTTSANFTHLPSTLPSTSSEIAAFCLGNDASLAASCSGSSIADPTTTLDEVHTETSVPSSLWSTSNTYTTTEPFETPIIVGKTSQSSTESESSDTYTTTEPFQTPITISNTSKSVSVPKTSPPSTTPSSPGACLDSASLDTKSCWGFATDSSGDGVNGVTQRGIARRVTFDTITRSAGSAEDYTTTPSPKVSEFLKSFPTTSLTDNSKISNEMRTPSIGQILTSITWHDEPATNFTRLHNLSATMNTKALASTTTSSFGLCTPPVIHYQTKSAIAPAVSSIQWLGPSINEPTTEYIPSGPYHFDALDSSVLVEGADLNLTTDYGIAPNTGVLEYTNHVSLSKLQAKPYISRIGGPGGHLNCQNVFVFSETSVYVPTTNDRYGKYLGSVSSSVAIDKGQNAQHGKPLVLQDCIGEWADATGGMRGFAPLTLGEELYNQKMHGDDYRFYYSVSPSSSLIPFNRTHALMFPSLTYQTARFGNGFAGGSGEVTGNTLLAVSVPGLGGPRADRLVSLMFGEGEVTWGTLGGLRSYGPGGPGENDGRVYVFGTGSNGLLLGRVEAESFHDKCEVSGLQIL